MSKGYQYINVKGQEIFHRYCKNCFNWIAVKDWKGQFPSQGNNCSNCRTNKNDRQAISLKKRFSVFSRDSFTCRYCGQSAPKVKLHLDHILPFSKGGDNSLNNLLTACQDCNLGKSDIILNAVCRSSSKVNFLDA